MRIFRKKPKKVKMTASEEDAFISEVRELIKDQFGDRARVWTNVGEKNFILVAISAYGTAVHVSEGDTPEDVAEKVNKNIMLSLANKARFDKG